MHMNHDHILWLDLETRSRVNLKTHGAYKYKDCPDHRVLVAGWALGNGKPEATIIGPDGALPHRLRAMLADPKLQIRAHNAAFDRLQLKDQAPPIDRWYCTAAQARGIALPGKLEDLGRAVGASIRKNPRGAELIQLLSIPDKHTGTFLRHDNQSALMREFADYCADDIATMRACSLGMPDLRDEDLRVYHASERINDRGLPIDVELCTLATQYAEAEAQEAASAVIVLSAGALRTVRGTKLRDWVYERLDPTLRKHMDLFKDGQKKTSLATDIRATLLDIAEENPDAIDPVVVQMIEAAEAGAMSSTAKFQTMLNRVSDDGRLRGAFVFNGAYQTNRFSSTGAQVHNFPRLVAADPESVLATMRQGKPLDGTLRTLKSLLRPAIAPKQGKVIVRCDWNAIEARGLPWLVDVPGAQNYRGTRWASRATRLLAAGEKLDEESHEHRAFLASKTYEPARDYLAAFTDGERDIYVEQAEAAALGDNRQAGKVVVLSLGYGGGEGALSKMAKNYGVSFIDADAVVSRWRAANGWVADKKVGWWASLARCALVAMRSPGHSMRAGRVVLQRQGSSLTMRLPSGRVMHYPMAKVVEGDFGPEIAYLKASWKPKADAKEWPTGRLWHGILAENATQAACADLLRETLVRCEADGIEVIGHVHDEIITEAPIAQAKSRGRELQRCMLVSPPWATGFPLKAEVDISPRFRK
jgi:DNA polymerase